MASSGPGGTSGCTEKRPVVSDVCDTTEWLAKSSFVYGCTGSIKHHDSAAGCLVRLTVISTRAMHSASSLALLPRGALFGLEARQSPLLLRDHYAPNL